MREENGTRIVGVRAVPRPGFNNYFRGGHRWPVDGRTVRVTEELLAILRREQYLAVDYEPDESQCERGVLEYIDNRIDDRAHNASRGTRERLAELEAEKARLELADKARALEAEVAALRAKQVAVLRGAQ